MIWLGNHSPGNTAERKKLEPLKYRSPIILTKPLDDHPLVAGILIERIIELSKSPEQETVVLVAHGPNDEDDNKQCVRTMESIADQIRGRILNKKISKPFSVSLFAMMHPKQYMNLQKKI